MNEHEYAGFMCNRASENSFDIGNSWYSGIVVFGHVLLCFVLLLIGMGCAVDSNNTLALEVAAPRPMAEAVIALGEQLKCPVTYEDIPFEYSDDLRSVFPGSQTRVPSGGLISLSYKQTADMRDILRRLLSRYKAAGNTGKFAVTKVNGIYSVYCIGYRNKSGKLIRHSPILDTRISLSLQNSNCFNVVRAICKELSKPDRPFRIGIGMLPRDFNRVPISINLIDTPAREVVNIILARYNETLIDAGVLATWQLRFSPSLTEKGNQHYILGFREISLQSCDHNKMRVIAERPMATVVQILEKQFGEAITYEDPPSVCSCEVIEGSDKEVKGLRGGIININWDPGSDSVEQVLKILVQTPIAPRHTQPMFGLERGSRNNHHVYPLLSRDEEGNFVSRTSILDKQVTIEAPNINALTFLQEICAKLSDTADEDVVLGLISKGLARRLRNHTFRSVSINEKRALDCLDEFLGKVSEDISWHLIYEPSSGSYILIPYDISQPLQRIMNRFKSVVHIDTVKNLTIDPEKVNQIN